MRRWKGGQRAFFEYHCWESPLSADAHLWKRTRQWVTVIRRLTRQEACNDFDMHAVRFDDGLVGHVFGDELLRRSHGRSTT